MASAVHCRVDCESPVFPSGRVISIIRIAWDAPNFPPPSKDPQSLTLLHCSVVCLGWIRSSMKDAFKDDMDDISPYLKSRYKKQTVDGQIKQLFSSDPVIVCSNVSVQASHDMPLLTPLFQVTMYQGDNRIFCAELTLPSLIPPSFKGEFFGVHFALVVEFQVLARKAAQHPRKAIPISTRTERHGTSARAGEQSHGHAACAGAPAAAGRGEHLPGPAHGPAAAPRPLPGAAGGGQVGSSKENGWKGSAGAR